MSSPRTPMSFAWKSRTAVTIVERVRYGEDSCDIFIRRVDPMFGVERFYLDERKAKDLAWIPTSADAYVTAVVSRDGSIHVTNLVIDNKPVRE